MKNKNKEGDCMLLECQSPEPFEANPSQEQLAAETEHFENIVSAANWLSARAYGTVVRLCCLQTYYKKLVDEKSAPLTKKSQEWIVEALNLYQANHKRWNSQLPGLDMKTADAGGDNLVDKVMYLLTVL